MNAPKTENQPAQPSEKYEQPEAVKLGRVVDLTNGNTGSSTDSNSQTIPVQR